MLKYLNYFQTSLLLAAVGWLLLRALFLRFSRAISEGRGTGARRETPFGSVGGEAGMRRKVPQIQSQSEERC